MRPLSCAGSDTPAPKSIYERLRRLAVEDPKEAKKVFLTVFESNSEELYEFLKRLSKPNEGRLRQVVANAVRTHPHKGRIVQELLTWRETETDEFTRRAIEGALVDVDTRAVRGGRVHRQIAEPSELAGVYRYVSKRLKHRLRNTLVLVRGQANRLKHLLPGELNPEIQTTFAKLNDAINSVGRDLEVIDVDPEHFQDRSIALADWLRQLNLRYANQFSPVNLVLVSTENSVRIFANDYLLEIIFWNIWVNAHQATGANCQITIEFKATPPDLYLLISDNGEGFPADLKDIVFQQVYSTKNLSRGDGLLEIQDAVERLAGRVQLYEARPSEFRIEIRLPLDVQ